MDLGNLSDAFGARVAYGVNSMVEADSIPLECAFAGYWFTCSSNYDGSGMCAWVMCYDFECVSSFYCETYFFCGGGDTFDCLSSYCGQPPC